MKFTARQLAISLTALGFASATGCATGADVVVDERADLSALRTWDWLPTAPSEIDAPHDDAARLEARLARLIALGLAAKGFERRRDRPDVYLSYRLVARRRTIETVEPRAGEFLSSHHSSPSYVIEASRRVTRSYLAIHLAIRVTGGGGELLWRARLEQQSQERFGRDLDEAVATLLDRLPERSGRRLRGRQFSGTRGPRPRRIAGEQADPVRWPRASLPQSRARP